MSKRLALIVEDNVELGYIYAAALELAGYGVEHILDGKAALNRLEGEVPALILLDMNMPHVSGHYIYKQIRADARFTHTPVIIATANSLIAEALGHELGNNDLLLIKPVSPTQLRDLARRLINAGSTPTPISPATAPPPVPAPPVRSAPAAPVAPVTPAAPPAPPVPPVETAPHKADADKPDVKAETAGTTPPDQPAARPAPNRAELDEADTTVPAGESTPSSGSGDNSSA